MNPSELFSSMIPKQTGESRFQPVVPVTHEMGIGPVAPMSFETAFIEVATFHAAIERVAQDAASVKLDIMRKNSDGSLTLLDPDKDETARVFAKANRQQGPTEMWEEWHTFYEVLGEGFMLLDHQDPPRAKPQELWVLPPRKMEVKTDRFGVIDKFNFDKFGPNPETYEPSEIFFQKKIHPQNDFRGLASTQSAIAFAALEVTSSKHWLGFFKHGARLSAVIETDRKLNRARVKEYLREFREQYDGVANAFKTLLLHSGFKLRETGVSQKDADFVNLFKISREQQLVATGVPPALVGIFEFANYANSEQQIRIYWQNKILPRLKKLQEGLSEIVLPRFAPGLVARFDLASIPALQEMLLEKAERMSKLVTGGVFTPNNARAELGLSRVSGGDGLFLPAGLAPVGIEINPQRDARIVSQRSQKTVHISEEAKRIDSPERNMKRQAFLQEIDEFEKPVLADWIKYTNAQERRILTNLANEDKAALVQYGKAIDADDIFDIQVEVDAAKQTISKVYTNLISKRGTEAAAEVGTTFAMDAPEIVAFILREQGKESILVAGADQTAIRTLITDLVRENATIDQIAAAIQEHYVLERFQARTIARTETIRGFNFSTGEAWKQSDVVEKKEWLTTLDGEQRDEHDDADGEKVGVNESFVRTGEELEYPGDPGGSGWNVINCRCTMLPFTGGKQTAVVVQKGVWERLFKPAIRNRIPEFASNGG